MTEKVALVTGGTRGIGNAIARQIASEGMKVFVTGTSKEPPRDLGHFEYLSVDFTNLETTLLFAKEIKNLPIDILINNAGINKVSPFEDISFDDFAKIQQVNVNAPMLVTQAVLPYMKKKHWGRIVNITSIFGVVSREFRASYSTSKFGLNGLTAALALEVARHGILANCVAPGFIDTDLTQQILGPKGIEEIVTKIPLGRLANATEIAKFVAWLASPANTYICGQNLVIDGGYTCA